MNSPYAIAVKSIILKENKVLVLKRHASDPHNPATWDIPGGRLNPSEDPFVGMRREVKEETGLDVVINMTLDTQQFTRQDGQHITMIFFLCTPTSTNIQLSEEHTEYAWKTPNDPELANWIRIPLAHAELLPQKLTHHIHNETEKCDIL